MQDISGSPQLTLNPQLAEKLFEVRTRAEQQGQVFTNLPKERYADAKFDDSPHRFALPALRKNPFQYVPGNSVLSSSPAYFSPVSSERMDIHRCGSTGSPLSLEIESPLPFVEESKKCSKCCAPSGMKRLYLMSFIGNILTHSCSICCKSLSKSSTVNSLSPQYPFTVAHECELCGWRMCIRCNIIDTVESRASVLKKDVEQQFMESCKSEMLLLRQSNISGKENGIPSTITDSLKGRLIEVENQLGQEKKVKEQVSSLLSSIQKEYIQYKADVELQMESSAAERVILQSRLVEQSVLIADARARIDELTSVRRISDENNQGLRPMGSFTEREALLTNENNHLKEEIDSLKMSIHADFDSWKRSVLKQVKAECVRYKERVRQTITLGIHGESDTRDDDDLMNAKELDFLFDEVDWTCGIDELQKSPERMREYLSSRSSTPDSRATSTKNVTEI